MGLIDSIIGAESGGNPNAQNPNSSASGSGQFIDSTWLDTLKAHRPDIAQGQSDADLLALKTNPQLSAEMTGAYAADNGKILANAGHPVTPGNTYLAHFAGPQGAVSVLNADPLAPVASILPGAMKANPFLQGMTAGDLRNWANHKMGGARIQSSQASGTIPTNAPQAPPIFAQQPQQAAQPQQQAQPQADFQDMQAPPIFASPRKQIDISKLMAAFKAPTFYGRG